MRTRIKICGVCRVEDALLAAGAGADAVGMIFHPASRRNIPVERGREIVSALGAFVTPVGVFVDAGVETISGVAGAVKLGVVQLHGREGVEEVVELGRRGLRVLKAVRVDESFEEQLDQWRGAMGRIAGVLVGIVLETGNTPQAGGTGVANDWEAVKRHLAAGRFDGLPPVVAAGGLSPETVGRVVREIGPWAVDVSSGVEAGVGVKSREKVLEFVAAVREAGKTA